MSLAAAAAGSAIGGGSMAHRLDSTGGFIDWRRRRTAAVPGTMPSLQRSHVFLFSNCAVQ